MPTSLSASPLPPVLEARAACRVDLAGGTVDMWPLYLFHPGAVVVNIAVDIWTSCRLTPRHDGRIELRSHDTAAHDSFASIAALAAAKRYGHPLAANLVSYFHAAASRENKSPQTRTETATFVSPFADGLQLETNSESPAGAGISGSSALMIATAAALARYCGRRLGAEKLRELAQNIEARLIGVPTGCQDYYPAIYGSASAIELAPDGIRRTALACSPDELERRFALVYTGAPHNSGINNWEVFRHRIDGDRRVVQNFDRITAIACAMREALAAADWNEVARLLREEWRQRRTNAPSISTPFIDQLLAVARRHGGLAGKVCGAGGGGCVLLMTAPDARARVEQAMREAGATVLPFAVAGHGVRVRRLT